MFSYNGRLGIQFCFLLVNMWYLLFWTQKKEKKKKLAVLDMQYLENTLDGTRSYI